MTGQTKISKDEISAVALDSPVKPASDDYKNVVMRRLDRRIQSQAKGLTGRHLHRGAGLTGHAGD